MCSIAETASGLSKKLVHRKNKNEKAPAAKQLPFPLNWNQNVPNLSVDLVRVIAKF